MFFFKLSTELFTDLGKLNFQWWFGFRLELIFNTAPVAPKNTAQFKNGQNQPQNSYFASLI